MFNSRQLSTEAASIKNYEIQISRFIFHAYPGYLCRVSFLTTIDLYKDYFKGRLRWSNLLQSDYSLKLWLETICPSSYLLGYIWFNVRIYVNIELANLLTKCILIVIE